MKFLSARTGLSLADTLSYVQLSAIIGVAVLLSLSAAGLVAGLPLNWLFVRSEGAAACLIIILALAFWPALHIAISNMTSRPAWRCWGVASYPFAALTLMEANFDKPFGLGVSASLLPVFANLGVVALCTWIIVEMIEESAHR